MYKDQNHMDLCALCKATFTEKKFYTEHVPECLAEALAREKIENGLLMVMVEQASIPKHTHKGTPNNNCRGCEYESVADELEKILGYRKEGR